MSKVKLSEFDLYGTFRLTKDETAGIENLVQKLGENEYLSRNAHYYPTMYLNLGDAAIEYERLNDLLPMSGKPAFVVCEKMHELAVRVVNTIRQQNNTHLFQNGEHFDTVAQKCAQECADNLVRLINHQSAKKTSTKLSDETRVPKLTFLHGRCIEANNIKQLYMCANALPNDTEHLITPGGGSSKLGTLVQAVRHHKGLKPLGFTQINYSRDEEGQRGQVFTRPLPNLPEKLLVMDDFIYLGRTLANIKKGLIQQGHQVTNGAITASFYCDKYNKKSVFSKQDWANHIDIIPNQYAWCNEQDEIRLYLNRIRIRNNPDDIKSLKKFLDDWVSRHTIAYRSMRTAERDARELGANLYKVSEKISPAAVAYNQKIRTQVKKYDAEYQESLK